MSGRVGAGHGPLTCRPRTIPLACVRRWRGGVYLIHSGRRVVISSAHRGPELVVTSVVRSALTILRASVRSAPAATNSFAACCWYPRAVSWTYGTAASVSSRGSSDTRCSAATAVSTALPARTWWHATPRSRFTATRRRSVTWPLSHSTPEESSSLLLLPPIDNVGPRHWRRGRPVSSTTPLCRADVQAAERVSHAELRDSDDVRSCGAVGLNSATTESRICE